MAHSDAANRPALSVIIPVHNGEATIGACLSSLHASTYREYEVLVVDDASVDDTVTVVEAFACSLVRSALNGGAACARNLGASHASGDILFFLDADILVQPASLALIVAAFKDRADINMMFGSFHPVSVPANFYSRYKNLVHHYTHQTSCEEATTFCGGFGAIRREAFFAAGGFDPRYRFLEDVELGLRMHRSGNQIWLNKSLQFFHCKHYTLRGLIRSDLYQRAVPWTRLILKTGALRNDLNTRTANVLSVLVAYLLLLTLPFSMYVPGSATCVTLLLTLVWLNRAFLDVARRQYGVGFMCRAIVMCWVTYLYSGLGVLLGISEHLVEKLLGLPADAEAVP